MTGTTRAQRESLPYAVHRKITAQYRGPPGASQQGSCLRKTQEQATDWPPTGRRTDSTDTVSPGGAAPGQCKPPSRTRASQRSHNGRGSGSSVCRSQYSHSLGVGSQGVLSLKPRRAASTLSRALHSAWQRRLKPHCALRDSGAPSGRPPQRFGVAAHPAKSRESCRGPSCRRSSQGFCDSLLGSDTAKQTAAGHFVRKRVDGLRAHGGSETHGERGITQAPTVAWDNLQLRIAIHRGVRSSKRSVSVDIVAGDLEFYGSSHLQPPDQSDSQAHSATSSLVVNPSGGSRTPWRR